jgi:hypothetical protein
MAKIRICKFDGCKNAATTRGFCRLHYLKNWKAIKDEEKKLAAERLNRYVERVCREHPDRFLEVIRDDIEHDRFGDYQDEEGVDARGPEGSYIFDDEAYEEEIDRLIRELKIQKGF